MLIGMAIVLRLYGASSSASSSSARIRHLEMHPRGDSIGLDARTVPTEFEMVFNTTLLEPERVEKPGGSVGVESSTQGLRGPRFSMFLPVLLPTTMESKNVFAVISRLAADVPVPSRQPSPPN